MDRIGEIWTGLSDGKKKREEEEKTGERKRAQLKEIVEGNGQSRREKT